MNPLIANGILFSGLGTAGIFALRVSLFVDALASKYMENRCNCYPYIGQKAPRFHILHIKFQLFFPGQGRPASDLSQPCKPGPDEQAFFLSFVPFRNLRNI